MRTPGECKDCEVTIGQRDRAEEAADALADAIAAYFNVDIGEHVGGQPGNCPWQNALEEIEKALAEREHGEREMEQLSRDGQL